MDIEVGIRAQPSQGVHTPSHHRDLAPKPKIAQAPQPNPNPKLHPHLSIVST